MKAIVTGGAGFIGSHLVERLLKEDIEVHVIDNLSRGRLDNLEHLKGDADLFFHKMDISDYNEEFVRVFENADYVFHLAALAEVIPSINDPLTYHRSNVEGSINVLEAAKGAGIKKMVYVASSSCYGIPDSYPTNEDAEIQIQHPYALTKYLGESYALFWNQIYGLPVNSLRFFNVYGPRSRTDGTYGAVFGVFLAQKINGEPFTVVGDGKQSRDFTYVTDIVEAMWKAAITDVSGEIFNIGSGSHYTINRMVELMGGEVSYIPKRPGEPDCSWADISKAKELLGWEPKVTFEEGVQHMLDNIDFWKNAPIWTPEMIEEATKEWFRYLG